MIVGITTEDSLTSDMFTSHVVFLGKHLVFILMQSGGFSFVALRIDRGINQI